NSVSRGIAIGRVVCLHGTNRQYFRIDVPASGVENEIAHLSFAFASAIRRLSRLSERTDKKNISAGHGIFQAHRANLTEPSLQGKIEEKSREERSNAEWAVKLVSD